MSGVRIPAYCGEVCWRCGVTAFVHATVVGALATAFSAIAGDPPSATPSTGSAPLFAWDAKRQGAFVLSLCSDLEGRLWVGTEDNGVWCWDPEKAEDDVVKSAQTPGWTHFTRQSTGGQPERFGPVLSTGTPEQSALGDDNAYAIACDKVGRIWVGHLNHGVSVYNGKEWRNYDVFAGPLGERVFDIAVCPTDGDVWIATNAGLTRYSVGRDAWFYYTRADGLVSDQVETLAFDKAGNLYAGTQCDGLMKAQRTGGGEYPKWQHVPGADAMPNTPTGIGLPTNLLNDVLVGRDGTICVATNMGLAASRDSGRSWRFTRGKDWEAKVKGLHNGLKPMWTCKPEQLLLQEDYVTSLAEDGQGKLWIGHRKGTVVRFDPVQKNILPVTIGQGDAKGVDYVTAMVQSPTDPTMMILGTYGHGLVKASFAPGNIRPIRSSPHVRSKRAPTWPSSDSVSAFPMLPSPAKPPTVEELKAILSQVTDRAHRSSARTAPIVVLSDDWRTQGDWLGRYGRYWACCCAIRSPSDYVWGAGSKPIQYSAMIGPHHAGHDSIRYWVHWLYTDNRRSLEMPPTYLHSRVLRGLTTWSKNRRQAEWDDHGEAYPMTYEGPDLYCTLTVPNGLFILSLYDFNKDGHDGPNRFRDYFISIRRSDQGVALHNIAGFERQPELARSRVRDFWGGVWKQFLVQGPMALTIRVGRECSFNTILAGVMLDLVDEEPPPYFSLTEERNAKRAKQDVEHDAFLAAVREAAQSPSQIAPQPASKPKRATLSLLPNDRPKLSPAEVDLVDAVRDVVDGLDELRRRNPARWALCSRPCYVAALRSGVWANGDGAASKNAVPVMPPRLLGTCQYHCNLFCDWEQTQIARGLTPARKIERALRWDGVTYSYEGKGYQVVRAYLREVMAEGVPLDELRARLGFQDRSAPSRMGK